MSRPDTRAIAARAEAATAGPWGWDDGNVFCKPLSDARHAAVVAYCEREPSARDPNASFDMDPRESVASCPQDNPDHDINQRFIAAARTDVPALCDRVEALERALRFAADKFDDLRTDLADVKTDGYDSPLRLGMDVVCEQAIMSARAALEGEP